MERREIIEIFNVYMIMSGKCRVGYGREDEHNNYGGGAHWWLGLQTNLCLISS